jgi:hypothetical protein
MRGGRFARFIAGGLHPPAPFSGIYARFTLL